MLKQYYLIYFNYCFFKRILLPLEEIVSRFPDSESYTVWQKAEWNVVDFEHLMTTQRWNDSC